MTALVVSESCFGNTRRVAEAIAAGLANRLGNGAVSLVDAASAPAELPEEIDLVVIGAPTHNLTLPGPSTRRQAVAKGGVANGSGVREWIQRLTPRPDLRVVTFDTSVPSRLTLGNATRSAARALKRRGFRGVVRGPSFYVGGVAGPLNDGEEQRARTWGETLASSGAAR